MRLPPHDTFRALGDPIRSEIVELLGLGPRSVTELVGEFSVSQPAISRHLKVLRDAGLVVARREGRRQIYALRSEPLQEIEAWVEATHRKWGERLERLKAHVERERETDT